MGYCRKPLILTYTTFLENVTLKCSKTEMRMNRYPIFTKRGDYKAGILQLYVHAQRAQDPSIVFRPVLELSDQNNSFYSISTYIYYKKLYFSENSIFEKKMWYSSFNLLTLNN